MDATETRIGEWRAAILRGRAVDETDADELESHLRDQIADLEKSGLTGDEAFLVAVRRLGEVDRVTAEYAREHSDRLWKQLAMPHADDEPRRPLLVMLGFAVLAAVLVQAARLLATGEGVTAPWFVRDLSLFVLPVLAAYFAVVRRMPWRRFLPLIVIVALLAIAVNLFPFQADPDGVEMFGAGPGAATGVLVMIHLPVLLWFVVGAAYLGGEVATSARRMDFIRFTGEWAIYYALIALGGAVLIALTAAILAPIAPGAIDDLFNWVVPTGAAGAVIVAAWLVEAKKSIVENLAPVLTAIFTPLFAAMLLVAAAVYAVSGIGRGFDRDLLTVFDVLLLVVLGLVVYGLSARSTGTKTGLMDVVRLVAVVAAVALDALVFASMLARVAELGFTANRAAALGLNVILLVNLLVTAWLIVRLLAGRAQPSALERWQTSYLPVFAGWVCLVVLVLPPAFAFA
ncbi:MAG: permease prefix domain 1-containing protein [Pseudolysinimonas sp.]